MASTVPACQAYDPAFAYELSIIIQQGLRRMYVDNEDVFYYLTLYNENYEQPPVPTGVEQGVLQGLYRWAPPINGEQTIASILFSGPTNLSARQAQADLAEHWDIGVDLWSATSYKRLREQGMEIERWNRLHPTSEPREPLVTSLLGDHSGPVVAVSDFMRAVPEQIAPFCPRRFVALGTDGYGRSDDRQALRSFFEIDTPNIVVTVLSELAKQHLVQPETVAEAIEHYGLNIEGAAPWTR